MDSETLRTLFEPRDRRQRRPSGDPDAPKARSPEVTLSLSRIKEPPNLRADQVGLTPITLTLT